jgi:lipid-binding SYLF domain-containing protein
MRRLSARIAIATVLGGLVSVGARMAQATTDTEMIGEAQRTLALYQKTDPGLAMFVSRSAGYAVFPTVTKGAVGIGGAHGTGILFEKGRPIGKASLSQVSVGAQIGGQEYSEIIFFETPRALMDFEQGHAAFSAAVSAVALKSGASANAKYREGVAVFTATKGGLMAEASVGGQKFSFEPFVRTQ